MFDDDKKNTPEKGRRFGAYGIELDEIIAREDSATKTAVIENIRDKVIPAFNKELANGMWPNATIIAKVNDDTTTVTIGGYIEEDEPADSYLSGGRRARRELARFEVDRMDSKKFFGEEQIINAKEFGVIISRNLSLKI